MNDLTLLTRTVRELERVITNLGDDDLEVVSNCPPWTIRRLASHVLKNQLFWAGCVTGQELMPQAEAMEAVPYAGDLAPVAAEVCHRVLALWATDDVFDRHHVTPFGELPGSVVVNFSVIDAAAHAWDLSSSLGRPIDFPPEWIPGLTEVVAVTCTDHAVEIGLITPPTQAPAGATDTQRLMALAGREV
jgi:uncharacterized protein (TIGR03086 family)